VAGGQAIGFDDSTRELVAYIPAANRMIRLQLPIVEQRLVTGAAMRFTTARPRRTDDSTVEVYPDIKLKVVFAEDADGTSAVDVVRQFVEVTDDIATRFGPR
jgi:hypothetical protein